MNCDVGEATEGLENELWQVKRRKGWRMSCDVGEVTERLENEFILQLFFRFSYVTSSSLNSPGEPPMSVFHLLTLIVPRTWEIGYTQPCIKCGGNRQLINLFLKS